MVCFYEYVYPTIRMMRGFTDASLPAVNMKLLKDVVNPEDRAVFIRAKETEDGVMPLDKQDSGMMLSFAGGNTLIYIPNGRENVKAGEIVEVHLLPFAN
jgi:molybdopterin molybdotransferase